MDGAEHEQQEPGHRQTTAAPAPRRPGRTGRAAPGRTSARRVIAARNAANPSVPTAAEAVAVDDGDADPVVAGALGEGEGEDEEADQQRARLAPGDQRAATAGRLSLGGRRAGVGQEAPAPRRHHGRDGHGHDDAGARSRSPPARPSPAPTSAPATVPRLNPAWKRGMIERPSCVRRGALHVHRDVPRAVGEAEQEQPDDHGPTPSGKPMATTLRPTPSRSAIAVDGAPRPEPRDDRPDSGSASSEPAAMASSTRPSCGRRQLQPVTHLRDAGGPAGEREARPDEGGVRGADAGANPGPAGSGGAVGDWRASRGTPERVVGGSEVGRAVLRLRCGRRCRLGARPARRSGRR